LFYYYFDLEQEIKRIKARNKKKKQRKGQARKKKEFKKGKSVILFHHEKLSHRLKEKHINSITLKHSTIGLNQSIKLSNTNNSNKIKK